MKSPDFSNSDGPFRSLQVGKCRVDPEVGEIYRESKAIKMEPKVIEVLLYLIEHKNRVVSRQDLERDVWRGALVGYDSVTSTILKLRKAFGDDARHPDYIVTVPKKGYQLVAEVVVLDSHPDVSGRFRLGKNARPAKILGFIVFSVLVIFAGLQLSEVQDRQANVSESTEPLAQKAIVVLPFESLMEESAHELLVDGITDDIITDLSRLSNLLVIARSTSFTFKSRDVTPKEVGQELGVDYVLSGNVRRQGGMLRLNAQLVATDTGFQVWAERFDREESQIFSIQDEITQDIVRALDVRVTSSEEHMLTAARAPNLEAYEIFLEGQQLARVSSKESNLLAQEAYKKAIKKDPAYARAYGALAYTMAFNFRRGWNDAPQETIDRALELATYGIELDDSSPQVYWALGYVYLMRADFESSKNAVDRAIEIAPNFADGYGLLALINNNMLNSDVAVQQVKKGMTLNPFYTWDYPYMFRPG